MANVIPICDVKAAIDRIAKGGGVPKAWAGAERRAGAAVVYEAIEALEEAGLTSVGLSHVADFIMNRISISDVNVGRRDMFIVQKI